MCVYVCVMQTEKKGDVRKHYEHIVEQTEQRRGSDGKQSPRGLRRKSPGPLSQLSELH